MERTSPKARGTRAARSLPECLRQCLTPVVWRQARRGLPAPRKGTRWEFHHLVLVLLAMTWSRGDSAPERFAMARGIVAICRPRRRRAGATPAGFQKALCRLPMRPLVALAGAARGRLAALPGGAFFVAGFVPLGCDGSRLECVRNDQLLARMGKTTQVGAAPSLWVTALVHLATGVPWAWRLGKSDASERGHLRRMIPALPAAALVIADAGYVGYELAAALLAAKASFLIRMSSGVGLMVDRDPDLASFEQDEVDYWPQDARRKRLPPLRLRLIRVRGRRKSQDGRRQVDVWLLTDVMSPGRLSVAQAARFYRLRWENEGLFRTYKRTLAKVHLVGRTVRAVHREAFGSLLACQVLLTQGAWGLDRGRPGSAPVCSARKTLLAVRDELDRVPRPPRRQTYREALRHCHRERRQRTSAKQKRELPRRTPHKPPKPPRLRTMTDKEKDLLLSLNAVP